jgi:branched-chain amino acid transport system permease protein
MNKYLRFGGLALLGLVVLTLPGFVRASYLLRSAVLAGIYTTLCLGLSLIFGQAGQLSLAHAAFYGIGAYTSALLAKSLGVPVLIGIAAGTVLAGIVGYLLAAPILRLSQFYLAIATLAFGKIMESVFIQEVEITGGATGIALIPKPEIAGFAFDSPRKYYYLVWFVAAVCLLLSHNIARSKIGRALRALSSTESGARVMGIDTTHYKTLMFLIGAMFAGLAGGLYAHFMGFIGPDSFSSRLSVLVLVMVAVGGKDSIWGAVLGAIFTASVPSLLGRYERYAGLLYGASLLAIFMFAPGGVTGTVTELWPRLQAFFGNKKGASQGDSNGGAVSLGRGGAEHA